VILLQLDNLHLTAPESMQQAKAQVCVWEYVDVWEFEWVCVCVCVFLWCVVVCIKTELVQRFCCMEKTFLASTWKCTFIQSLAKMTDSYMRTS